MRTAARWAVAAVALIGGAVLLRPGSRAHRLVCRQLNEAGRRLRYLNGRLQGSRYRLRGQHPDPEVVDNVLADRIRSSLGALEKRLDLPHIHVMVEGHVALLHGEVTCDADIDKLTEAVADVSGVTGVESYLHVGLASGDTRPSAGRAVHPPSEALQRLLEVATDSGVPSDSASAVVRVILATFADRLPGDERDHVAAHLPADVRSLFAPPRRVRHEAPPRSVHELVARIAAATGELSSDQAERATAAVLENLRALVPEEAADVGAVLPPELHSLWQGHASK